MTEYIMRLDDACENRNPEKWNRMETMLDRYGVKPLVGIIPDCEDSEIKRYPKDPDFWERVRTWVNKGWTIALHGYHHVYITNCGGINPIHQRSEFAGVPLKEQKEKIRKGIAILQEHGVFPEVFFAPSHTFDENTLIALKECSAIRTISDTVAFAPYLKNDFVFVPQQSGRVRQLPFRVVTFCYHPNTMEDEDFEMLECFLKNKKDRFIEFPVQEVKRKYGFVDRVMNFLYMRRRRR